MRRPWLSRPMRIVLALTTLVCGSIAGVGAFGLLVLDEGGAINPIIAAALIYAIVVPAIFIIDRVDL